MSFLEGFISGAARPQRGAVIAEVRRLEKAGTITGAGAFNAISRLVDIWTEADGKNPLDWTTQDTLFRELELDDYADLWSKYPDIANALFYAGQDIDD